MIYLHTDFTYRPDQWWRRFEHILQRRGLAYRKVNLLRKDFRQLEVKAGDALIGRFGHAPSDLARMKPVYLKLAARFSGRIFPAAHTYGFYDDKHAQLALFQNRSYPTPPSAYVATVEDANRFLDETGLSFPLVTKKCGGAGSSNVRIANHHGEVFYPGILQEYCPGNDRDLRLVVIGERAMGFWRLNRPGDFRASGSGTLVYGEEFDDECLDLVHTISRDQGFDSMAYDLVRDKSGHWVVLEMSYAYVDECVKDCPFYYDLQTRQKVEKLGVYPQDFILHDFFLKHPAAAQRGRQHSAFGHLANLWRFCRRRPIGAGNQ